MEHSLDAWLLSSSTLEKLLGLRNKHDLCQRINQEAQMLLSLKNAPGNELIGSKVVWEDFLETQDLEDLKLLQNESLYNI